jgi:hypothetical protein
MIDTLMGAPAPQTDDLEQIQQELTEIIAAEQVIALKAKQLAGLRDKADALSADLDDLHVARNLRSLRPVVSEQGVLCRAYFPAGEAHLKAGQPGAVPVTLVEYYDVLLERASNQAPIDFAAYLAGSGAVWLKIPAEDVVEGKVYWINPATGERAR